MTYNIKIAGKYSILSSGAFPPIYSCKNIIIKIDDIKSVPVIKFSILAEGLLDILPNFNLLLSKEHTIFGPLFL